VTIDSRINGNKKDISEVYVIDMMEFNACYGNFQSHKSFVL